MQVLKEDVREKIVHAALKVFRDSGYLSATMAQIAGEAGISTGNIYRYFSTKDALFEEVIPFEFAETVKSRLREVLSMANGVKNVFDGDLESKQYREKAHEVLWRSAIERDRLVVLLDRSKGTKLESIKEEILSLFELHAIRYAESMRKEFKLQPCQRLILRLIYTSFLENISCILRKAKTDSEALAHLEAYRLYHLTGLKSFLEGHG
jgi:AcrR family transcriptional regulator